MDDFGITSLFFMKTKTAKKIETSANNAEVFTFKVLIAKTLKLVKISNKGLIKIKTKNPNLLFNKNRAVEKNIKNKR